MDSTYHRVMDCVLRIVFFSALGAGLLQIDSFGSDAATQQASQKVAYRFAAPFYPTTARDDIIIVLLDSDSVDELHNAKVFGANEWPVLYKDHAVILRTIAKYQPRAVFTDIYFRKKRVQDSSFDYLQYTLEYAKEEYSPNFLFAAATADEIEHDLSDIQVELGQVGDHVVVGWPVSYNEYPVYAQSVDATTYTKSPDTAAYALYRIACLSELTPLDGCNPASFVPDEYTVMSLPWGYKPASPALPSLSEDDCSNTDSAPEYLIKEFLKGLFNGLIDPASEAKCPYHRILYASQLAFLEQKDDKSRKRLNELLKDKVVIYGAQFDGLGDMVESPVQGYVPGVYLHAMALDNLMSLGDRVIRAGSDSSTRNSIIAWCCIVTLLSIMLASKNQLSAQLPFSTRIKTLVHRKSYLGLRVEDQMNYTSRQFVSGVYKPRNVAVRFYRLNKIRYFRPDEKHTFLVFFIVASAVIYLTAFVMYLWFRVEPVNFIGFQLLAALIAKIFDEDILTSLRSLIVLIKCSSPFRKKKRSEICVNG